MYICVLLKTKTTTKLNDMTNLTELLKKETETLKVQYIAMTEKWAISEFNNLREWVKEYKTGKFGFGAAERRYFKLPFHVTNSASTVEQYVEKVVKNAELHYQTSIEKLAARIETKGLNVNNLTTVTSHIGVNIETTLTDGSKTVRAFTIIAGGPVQKPHYRYLIK
jgi:hypothetical protein